MPNIKALAFVVIVLCNLTCAIISHKGKNASLRAYCDPLILKMHTCVSEIIIHGKFCYTKKDDKVKEWNHFCF